MQPLPEILEWHAMEMERSRCPPRHNRSVRPAGSGYISRRSSTRADSCIHLCWHPKVLRGPEYFGLPDSAICEPLEWIGLGVERSRCSSNEVHRQSSTF